MPDEQPVRWHWYHITTGAYGSWLYGDRRGFRTRHHREHVEGDYKNPPPAGAYDGLERRSKNLLKQKPVMLEEAWRAFLGAALRDHLIRLGAEVLSVAVSKQHVHIQAKMPFGQPRGWTGLAKKHAWFVARDAGWTGKLWAKRSKATPIKDRRHQINVYKYILKHRKEGAWVWSALEQEPLEEEASLAD